MIELASRLREPEVMDDPALDERRHLEALRGLERLNRFSASARILWSPLRALAAESGSRALRVLDIATGGGDVPIDLWRRARRHGLELRIDGCDVSERAVAYAARRAHEAGAEVGFFQLDALASEIPAGYDVVMSSLFLHHLADDEAIVLLRKMAAAARRLVLVNDLRRGRMGTWLVRLGTRFLSSSEVVRTDGLRSARAAFSLDEVRALARRAGLTGGTVSRRWPCRYLLSATIARQN